MLEKLRNIYQVPELRRRILFTLGLIVIYRLGEHVPTPGVNVGALTAAFRTQANTLFGMYDMFVGRAFSRATISSGSPSPSASRRAARAGRTRRSRRRRAACG